MRASCVVGRVDSGKANTVCMVAVRRLMVSWYSEAFAQAAGVGYCCASIRTFSIASASSEATPHASMSRRWLSGSLCKALSSQGGRLTGPSDLQAENGSSPTVIRML